MENKRILEDAWLDFKSATSFVPVIAAEIEFYLKGDLPEDILEKLVNELQKSELKIFDIKEEEGDGQFEVSLQHTENIVKLADDICLCRDLITNFAKEKKLTADFSAKPYANDYGSSMHFHISLHDENGRNIFTKINDDETIFMQQSLAGLLAHIPESMAIFAPDKNARARYVAKFDAPTTISWGGNNRTVALRLPTTSTEPKKRRIEHRLPAANVNPYDCIKAILAGINFGLVSELELEHLKIWGNAALEQYGLKAII